MLRQPAGALAMRLARRQAKGPAGGCPGPTMDAMTASDDGADFFLGEDIDLSDETVLRQLETVIEESVGSRRGVRVSVLSAEQWQTAVERLVPARIRKGVLKHFHVLPDPRNGSHLLVGPVTLAGLNERSKQMTAEVVYALLKAGDPRLPALLARGSADLIATDVAARLGVPFFASNYPRESQLCRALIRVVQEGHGGEWDAHDWLRVLKTKPNHFCLALRRTRFAAYWLACARRDERLAEEFSGARKTMLTDRLCEPELTAEEYFARFTRRCLEGWAAIPEGRLSPPVQAAAR